MSFALRSSKRDVARTARSRQSRSTHQFEALEARQVLASGVVINEFVAANSAGLKDQDGSFSDWIELHNTTAAPVSLEGWALTDDPARPTKWRFPNIEIAANEYLVVFASDKDRSVAGSQLHTNFKMSAAGEYLALVESDGTIASEFTPEFPPQSDNVSYGIFGGELRFFSSPTPGATNANPIGNPGPILSDLTENPPQPGDADDLVITVDVTASSNPVTQVRLFYRVMFNPEVQIPMVDDGTGRDATPNDGIYTAVIPAAASTPGQMVRWYATARDSANVTTRIPKFVDALDSPQYFGTVVADPSVATALPVLHHFIQNPSAADSSTGTRTSIFFDGEFYDNVKIDVHGQSTSGFPKKSYDFDLNTGYRFRWSDEEDRVKDFNLLTNYADKTKVRNTLAYETFKNTGSGYHIAFPVRVHRNGQFFSLADWVEDGDDIYLDRIGRDPDGALYKMYNTLDSSTNGVEKKTRKNENNSDLQALINGIRLPVATRANYLFDNIDMASVANFLATISIADTTDFGHKNYYLYRDTLGDREWEYLPWDVDLTFGHNWTSGLNYFDENVYVNNAPFMGQNNALAVALYANPAFRQMYLRRLRSLMDEFLQPPGTPADSLKFEKRIDELYSQMGPDAALDYAAWPNWGQPKTMAQALAETKNVYFPGRRNYLYNTQVVGKGGEIPAAQPDFSALPVDQRLITFGTIEYAPTSGNQDEEFIEIVNSNSFAVDISGWRLSDAVDFKFPAGTVIPSNSKLYVSPNVNAFRARTSGPSGNQGLFIQGGYDGHLSALGETVRLLDRNGVEIISASYAGNPSPAQQFLRITEVMYHPPAPPDGSPYTDDDFEYIEFQNIGPDNLSLNGVRFSHGVTIAFPDAQMSPGERAVVVRNAEAFVSRYGDTIRILGVYSGGLDNGGEKIRVEDSVTEPVSEFTYDDAWYPVTDGLGFSLVILDSSVHPNTWAQSSSWRPSQYANGNPGLADVGLNPGAVAINEVLTHSSQPEGDWIELKNFTAEPVDISGWYLSNDAGNLQKFRIPADTVIAAGGFLVFNERDHFNNASHSGAVVPFSMSELGAQVYLTAADAGGVLLGYREQETTGAAEPDIPFGRYIKSTGGSDFTPLSAATPGADNGAPSVGPVVFSEIMYAPLTGGEEYIEIHNISAAPVPLYDPANPTNTWRFTAGIDFAFPENFTLEPGGYAVLVATDPVAFRSKYGVPANVAVLGPYAGVLDNNGEKLELSKPGIPQPDQTVPYIRAEYVNYENSSPWPSGTNVSGAALARQALSDYSNDAASWKTGAPGGTPGRLEGDFTLSIDDVSIAEGDDGTANAIFTVTLATPRGQQVTVAYSTTATTATVGTDFTEQSGILTFAADTTTQTIVIPVHGDTADEPDETFVVQLFAPSNATIARGQGVATIVDDDPSPDVSISNVTLTERDGLITNAVFSVTLSKGSSQVIKVAYATVDGTAVSGADFFAKAATVTFNPGITSQTVIVSVVGDRLDEPNEEFYVDLLSSENANIVKARGTATIVDNDPTPTVSIANLTITEGNGGTSTAEFQVTLSAASGQEVVVAYETKDVTATAGSDYQARSGAVTIAAGSTSATIAVPVLGDVVDEQDETFQVVLSNPVHATLATAQATGTITDDDDGTVELPVVNNANDSGPGSLRAAIEIANASPSPPTITFQMLGPGSHVIQLVSALPALTQSTQIEIAADQTIEIGTANSFSLGNYEHLVKTGDGTLVLGGNQSPTSAATLVANAGTLIVQSDLGINASLVANSTVNFAASQHLAGLTIGDGATATLAAGGGKLLVVAGLEIKGAGRLDLTDNDLIVQASAATRDGVLSQVSAALTAGANNLNWDGHGITSSAASANPTHLTALGVMLNDNGMGGAFHDSFSGHAVDANSILVKYTYYGDADLTGFVDGTDYALINNGNNLGLTGWFNGDFSYDLLADGTDYALIDNAFNAQGAPIALAAPLATSTVSPAPVNAAQAQADSPSEPLGARFAALSAGEWEEIAIAYLAITDGRDPADDDLLDPLDDELLALLSSGLE